MKATDLMIGDWVQVMDAATGTPYNCRVRYTICPSMENALIGLDNKEISVSSLPAECLYPISITSEILEKNGFGYIETDEYNSITHFYLGEKYFCADMNIHIGTDNKGVFWFTTHRDAIYGINYVHELQHALKLCGIDKEITLD